MPPEYFLSSLSIHFLPPRIFFNRTWDSLVVRSPYSVLSIVSGSPGCPKISKSSQSDRSSKHCEQNSLSISHLHTHPYAVSTAACMLGSHNVVTNLHTNEPWYTHGSLYAGGQIRLTLWCQSVHCLFTFISRPLVSIGKSNEAPAAASATQPNMDIAPYTE